jgi:hypothetical protein
MSIQANTRLFDDSVLKVEDGLGGWIEAPEAESASGFGTPSKEIPTVSAASTMGDESRPGLPDGGEGTYIFFSNWDSDFQQQMSRLYKGDLKGDEVEFKIQLSEGTKDVGTFTAWVKNMGFTAEKDDVYKFTLKLRLTSRVDWASS